MASEEMDRLMQYLKRLCLRHTAQNLDDHLQKAAQLELNHFAFLFRVVEAEILARKETAAARRLSEAHFPEVCRLEDFDFLRQPCLNRRQVEGLAELRFIDRCEAVLWIGPSGVGKTHLAIALGVRACVADYHVSFVRARDLLVRLYASLADDTLDLVLADLSKPDLLIIDELGNSPRKPEEDFAGVFFELVAARHRHASTILTTNLGFQDWPSALGTAAQVTPAVDRLIDGAHIITFPPDAKSYRADRTEGPGPLPRKKRPPRRPRRADPTTSGDRSPRGRGGR